MPVSWTRRARAAAELAGRWVLRIVLPLAGAGAMLHLFPFHATAGGMHFTVQATLFTRSGITADTTFGDWIFDSVDGLPLGVHLSPQNVDVVRMAASATHDPTSFVARLREDFTAQVPWIIAWLAAEALLGVLIGLAAAAAVNLALRHLRELPRRPRELRRRVRQLAGVGVVLAVLAGYGALTYNPDWTKRSRLTGTLGALQLFPGQLREYYQQNATAFGVVDGVASIQAQLQHHLERKTVPDTAFNIMFISDMHLAATYPLVRQYARNFDVSLIVNTGDESQFGTSAEMSPGYLAQLKELTAEVPMVWLAGNHDSPTTERIMSGIPGVIVLGTKTTDASGGFAVTARKLDAYGLTIGGIPDPRVYGAAGPDGSNDPPVVDPLERSAMKKALQEAPANAKYDIFATHEPVAAAEIAHQLPGRVRQTNSGHLHHQNAASDVQKKGLINLVEGSTGAGGLKEIGLDVKPVPVEFSIESVAADCQFTRVVRFQIAGSAPASPDVTAPAADNVTASTLYLSPQKLSSGRECSTALGVGDVQRLGVS
jgi:predicted MPP superfamily phosphohydrolase